MGSMRGQWPAGVIARGEPGRVVVREVGALAREREHAQHATGRGHEGLAASRRHTACYAREEDSEGLHIPAPTLPLVWRPTFAPRRVRVSRATPSSSIVHYQPATLVAMQRLSPTITLPLLAVVIGVVAYLGFRGGSNDGWWCRDAAQADRHDNGRQFCWRDKAHCIGMCNHQPTAYCYDEGSGHYCLATETQCTREQEAKPTASSRCKAMK